MHSVALPGKLMGTSSNIQLRWIGVVHLVDVCVHFFWSIADLIGWSWLIGVPGLNPWLWGTLMLDVESQRPDVGCLFSSERQRIFNWCLSIPSGHKIHMTQTQMFCMQAGPIWHHTPPLIYHKPTWIDHENTHTQGGRWDFFVLPHKRYDRCRGFLPVSHCSFVVISMWWIAISPGISCQYVDEIMLICWLEKATFTHIVTWVKEHANMIYRLGWHLAWHVPCYDAFHICLVAPQRWFDASTVQTMKNNKTVYFCYIAVSFQLNWL